MLRFAPAARALAFSSQRTAVSSNSIASRALTARWMSAAAPGPKVCVGISVESDGLVHVCCLLQYQFIVYYHIFVLLAHIICSFLMLTSYAMCYHQQTNVHNNNTITI